MSTWKSYSIVEGLSQEKLDMVVYILESLTVKQNSNHEHGKLTPEEAVIIDIALSELENGLGVDVSGNSRNINVVTTNSQGNF